MLRFRPRENGPQRPITHTRNDPIKKALAPLSRSLAAIAAASHQFRLVRVFSIIYLILTYFLLPQMLNERTPHFHSSSFFPTPPFDSNRTYSGNNTTIHRMPPKKTTVGSFTVHPLSRHLQHGFRVSPDQCDERQ